MSAVNVRYGLYPGDRLMVTAEKKKKKATQKNHQLLKAVCERFEPSSPNMEHGLL